VRRLLAVAVFGFVFAAVGMVPAHAADVATTIVVDQGLVTEFRREPYSIAGLASFAEGPHGELYAISIFGAIYRLVR